VGKNYSAHYFISLNKKEKNMQRNTCLFVLLAVFIAFSSMYAQSFVYSDDIYGAREEMWYFSVSNYAKISADAELPVIGFDINPQTIASHDDFPTHTWLFKKPVGGLEDTLYVAETSFKELVLWGAPGGLIVWLYTYSGHQITDAGLSLDNTEDPRMYLSLVGKTLRSTLPDTVYLTKEGPRASRDYFRVSGIEARPDKTDSGFIHYSMRGWKVSGVLWVTEFDGQVYEFGDPNGKRVPLVPIGVLAISYVELVEPHFIFISINPLLTLTTIGAQEGIIPNQFDLGQNYPNPFNPETQIQYEIGKAGQVELTVYDLLGRLVRTLVDTEQTAGLHTVKWDARDDLGRRVASGVYVYQIKTGSFVETRKMILLK